MITKKELDKLVELYETKDFIVDDPISFPHRFNSFCDIEIAGFIASLFAYGNRKIFIKKLDELFSIMGNEPLNYLLNNDFSKISRVGFNYRFSKPKDIVVLFEILSKLYRTSKGLSELFSCGYENKDILKMQQYVVDYFYSNSEGYKAHGFCHLLPDPRKKCAMKRMNMFLRWMVRKSDVDLGIWDFIDKSELFIPLDVHVGRISRRLGLIEDRKSNNIQTVIELTSALRQFDKNDPVKYDFALFGKGIEDTLSNGR